MGQFMINDNQSYFIFTVKFELERKNFVGIKLTQKKERKKVIAKKKWITKKSFWFILIM